MTYNAAVKLSEKAHELRDAWNSGGPSEGDDAKAVALKVAVMVGTAALCFGGPLLMIFHHPLGPWAMVPFFLFLAYGLVEFVRNLGGKKVEGWASLIFFVALGAYSVWRWFNPF